MLYLAIRSRGEGLVEAYVTEDAYSASKLVSRDLKPEGYKDIDFIDVKAHFEIEAPEKGVTFTPHGTFKNAFRVSDNAALGDYLRKVKRISKLYPFNPERVDWETKRKENLEALLAKQKRE